MEQSCSVAKLGSFRQACEETADASSSQRQSRGMGPSQYSLPKPKPEMVARECGGDGVCDSSANALRLPKFPRQRRGRKEIQAVCLLPGF